MTDEKLSWMCTEPECERPRQGNLAFCATHLAEQRKKQREQSKPAKQVKPLKRSPVKKVSDKRKEQNTAYSAARATWIIGKRCACCGDPATEIHHKAGRTNELLLEKKYWLPVCHGCHQLITTNSAWAIKEGYSLPRNSKQEIR